MRDWVMFAVIVGLLVIQPARAMNIDLGLPIRDVFAVVALGAYIGKFGTSWSSYEHAVASYNAADAMMKVRGK